METSFLTSLLDPLWQDPCSGGIVASYSVAEPALAAAVGCRELRLSRHVNQMRAWSKMLSISVGVKDFVAEWATIVHIAPSYKQSTTQMHNKYQNNNLPPSFFPAMTSLSTLLHQLSGRRLVSL